jgi:hypothetical protein
VQDVAADAPAPDAPPAPQAESVAIRHPAPGDAPRDVHEASTVAQWTVVPQAPADPGLPAKLPSVDTNRLPTAPPQNLDPSYVKDLLKAIQSQSVSGNPALSSLA